MQKLCECNDIDFLTEYLRVMKPIAVGIDDSQSSDSYYAIFLPTVHKIKYSLESLAKTNLFAITGASFNWFFQTIYLLF